MKNLRILILNGPNLNLVGIREPAIYGSTSLDELVEQMKKEFSTCDLEHYQSNVEGELINKLHEVGFSYDGILFNPGGYTHTSVAIRDAVAAITTPVVEVHISDPASRETFRHASLVSDVCFGTVSGLGVDSYRVALETILNSH